MLRVQVDGHCLLYCQIKEQVGAYVGDLLRPRFKSGTITKEDYKWIVRKTVDKVQHFYVRLLFLSSTRNGRCCFSKATDFAWKCGDCGGYRHASLPKTNAAITVVFLVCRLLLLPLARQDQTFLLINAKPRLLWSWSTTSASANRISQQHQNSRL